MSAPYVPKSSVGIVVGHSYMYMRTYMCKVESRFLHREFSIWFGPGTPCQQTWTLCERKFQLAQLLSSTLGGTL